MVTLLEDITNEYSQWGEVKLTKHNIQRIRRALAIAQMAQHYADAGSTEARQIVREADELLEGK